MALLRFGAQAARDIRYALRMMAAQPLFTAMAALSLALGIGANTAIYSFMDAILLRALPVADPQSLVVLQWRSRDFPRVSHSFSGSGFKDLHAGYVSNTLPYRAYELVAASPVFARAFAFTAAGRLNVQLEGAADLAATEYVSGTFFSGLQVPPAAGRLVDAADDRAGAPPVAVLAYGYARRRFGEIAHALGRRLLINGNSFLIVGVAPPEFFGVDPEGPRDVYLPLHANLLLESRAARGLDPNQAYLDSNFYWLQVMARLRPGMSRPQAEAVLAPLFHNFVAASAATAAERADLPALFLADGAGGLDFLRRQYSKPLFVLMTLVAFILAIACANIANLLLARAASRRREIAVRLSLGAGRARIVRQLLTESVLLASLGGLAGVAFAAWGIRALTLLIANGREGFTLHADLNWRVLGVTLALSIVTGLLFGLAPSLQATRVDLVSALKQARAGGRAPSLYRRLRVSLSGSLAAGQVAICLLLVTAAGLFVHSLANLHAVSLGFNQERVLLFTINARQAGYQDAALVRFYDTLQSRLAAVPGVRSATASDFALVSGSMGSTKVRVPGYSGTQTSVSILDVAPGFFHTMDIPVLLGRGVEERDLTSPAPVAVVNEVFVKTYCAGQNPLGRRIAIGRTDNIEIVGVARNARYNSLKMDIPPLAYLPYSQRGKTLGQMVFELRAAGDPMGLAGAVRQLVREADARVPVSNILTEKRQIEQTISQERTFATLCTCFAALALVIACVGLYGMMAYRVARRANEIGIRMALGAQRPRVVRMIMREVCAICAAGLALGLAAALSASRLLEAFLFQMKSRDPLVLGLAPAVLLAAALLAGYGPARRAARVDPWIALRDE